MASTPNAQENSPGAKATAASATTALNAKLTLAIIACCTTLADRAISACPSWIAGEGSIALMTEKRTSLAGAMEKLAPMHHLIDAAALKQELEAFVHTADMAAYVANALRKEPTDPTVTKNFFDEHPEVHSFAIVHVFRVLYRWDPQRR